MGFIYIIKNIVNDKVYIGQTTQPIKNRMRAHRYAASSGINDKLHKAMREIGIDNFYIEKIKECDNKELNSEEVKYIKKYNSVCNGYNSDNGGSSAGSFIEENYLKNIIEMYRIGMTSGEIALLFNCSDITILNILKANGVEIRNNKIKVTLIELDMDFNTMADLARYIMINGYTHAKYLWSLCSILKNCCENHKTYNGMHICYTKEKDNYKCYKGKEIQYKEIQKITHCKVCSKPITKQSSTGMCNSCANVVAKGKSPKPSRDELKALINSGLSNKQIAEIYDRTISTICAWKRQI